MVEALTQLATENGSGGFGELTSKLEKNKSQSISLAARSSEP
jgi:hypothetical protein